MEHLVSQLTRLHELHACGGLSDQEYARAKEILLRSGVSPSEKTYTHPIQAEMPKPHRKQGIAALIASVLSFIGFSAYALSSDFTAINVTILLILIVYCISSAIISVHNFQQIAAQKNQQFEALRRELATRQRAKPSAPMRRRITT